MEHPDPSRAHVLPPDLYRRALHRLRAVLPPPLTGDPADTTERDLEAMEEVISLRPANAHETALAVQFVAANALAMDIMQGVTARRIDALKLWAASANMMRQSRGALTSLLRFQASRMKEARSNEAMARPLDPMAMQLPPSEPPPARSVTVIETESHLSVNETPMRRDSLAAARRPAAAPFIPDPAIIARMVADETLTRQVGAGPGGPVSRHGTLPARFVQGETGHSAGARRSGF